MKLNVFVKQLVDNMKLQLIETGRKRAIICNVVLLLGCLLSFSTVFFGLDFKDTFYYGCVFLYKDSVSAFLPLVQGIYVLASIFFGKNILVLRILNWLVYFLACFLFCHFIVIKEKRCDKNCSKLWLAIIVMLIPLTNTNVFSGYSLTVLGIVGVFVSVRLFLNGEKKWAWGIVCFTLLLLLSRFPNIVIIPILALFAPFLCGEKRKRVVVVETCVIMSVLFFFLINVVLFGGIKDYLLALTESYSSAATQVDSDHSIGYLFQEYMHSVKDIVGHLKYLSIISLIPLLTVLFDKRRSLLWILSGLYVLSMIAFVVVRVKIVSDVVNYFLLMYFYSVVCVVVFSNCVLALVRNDLRSFVWAFFPLVISSCAAAGSDTGLVFMGGPLMVFVPWIFIQHMEYWKTIEKKEAVCMMLALVGLAIGSALYVRGQSVIGTLIFVFILLLMWFIGANSIIDLQFKKGTDSIWKYRQDVINSVFVIMCFLTLTYYVKTKVSFHDRPLKDLKCQHEDGCLRGVWTNKTSCDFVSEVMGEYRDVSSANQEVVFFGNCSAIFGYITGIGMIPEVDYPQHDCGRNIKAIQHLLEQKKPVIFLCPRNPGIEGLSVENYPNVDTLLINNGYHADVKHYYSVYYPNI